MIGARAERIARVHAALAAAGVAHEARELSANTATAALAAEALGCAQAQIAKTIVFRGAGESGDSSDGAPVAVIAVLCGDDRVDVRRLAALAGKKLGKADAAFVNQQCGFEIGGVAPLGFPAPLPVFLENRLLRFSQIWAAAGSAHAVFGIAPRELPRATGGVYADFAAA